MSLLPAKSPIDIWRDGTFRKVITLTAGGSIWNLSGYTGALKVYKTGANEEETLLELTTENGGIEIEGAKGELALFIAAEDTEALEWTSGTYELLIKAPEEGDTYPLLWGAVRVKGI